MFAGRQAEVRVCAKEYFGDMNESNALNNVQMISQYKVLFCRLATLAFFLSPFSFPFVSHAETTDLRADLAQSAIWMSRAHVVAGESVNIFTVLYNSSDNSISGDVVFSIDDASIGTKNFTLGAGETQIMSVPWVAKSGNHTASARIEKAAGSDINASVLNQTTGTISVLVAPPLPPSPAAQVLNTVTSAIQTGAASTAPLVLSAVHSIYDATESLRTQAKTALEKNLAKNALASASTLKQESAGTSDNEPEETSENAGAATPMLSKALRYIAAAGLVVVSSKGLFYISLALLLLLLIQVLRVSLRDRRRGRGHLPLD